MLKKNGVVNRDEYFNKEEKAMLDDVNYLKKHGYEDDFEKEWKNINKYYVWTRLL